MTHVLLHHHLGDLLDAGGRIAPHDVRGGDLAGRRRRWIPSLGQGPDEVPLGDDPVDLVAVAEHDESDLVADELLCHREQRAALAHRDHRVGCVHKDRCSSARHRHWIRSLVHGPILVGPGDDPATFGFPAVARGSG